VKRKVKPASKVDFGRLFDSCLRKAGAESLTGEDLIEFMRRCMEGLDEEGG